ncbi:MAG TPA: hypothetical protein VGN34_16330 [Ktedonobacteraceae bacterium]
MASTANGGAIYQLWTDGSIWVYRGTGTRYDTPWTEIDANPATTRLSSSSDYRYIRTTY